MIGEKVDLIPGEIFKEIPHKETKGKYLASNYGRVKRMYRDRFGRDQEYLIKPKLTEKGGKSIVMYLGTKSNHRVAVSLGKLVLSAFKPCDDMMSMSVIYRDGDCSNCNLNNLQWATRAEKFAHDKNHAKRKMIYPGEYLHPVTGEKKIQLYQIPNSTIREILSLSQQGYKQVQIAKRYGLSQAAVSYWLSGKRRKEITSNE